MKAFENLGRSLSKEEQKRILGGVDESLPCNSGLERCSCSGGPLFYCCIDYEKACLTAHGCSTTDYLCAH